jgi:hypothetical protein
VRLLAPRAELRLLVAGSSSMVDAVRLSYLGEALRALLVMEARTATLVRYAMLRSRKQRVGRGLPVGVASSSVPRALCGESCERVEGRGRDRSV